MIQVAELFYIMGASGAGKDTLMQYARHQLGDTVQVVFARRYITRPADYGTEHHIPLSIKEFADRHRKGFFALAWDSHGFSYGIDQQTTSHLGQGKHVIMNGSRSHLEQAAAQFNELHPVLIQASDALLQHRMRQRGRETEKQIEKRIEHSKKLQTIRHPKLSLILNNSTIEHAGTQLLNLLLARTAR